MLSVGRNYITSSPQLAVIPGMAILVVTLAFNVVGMPCGTRSIPASCKGRAAGRYAAGCAAQAARARDGTG